MSKERLNSLIVSELYPDVVDLTHPECINGTNLKLSVISIACVTCDF